MRNIPKGKVNNVKYVVTEEIGVGGKKIKRAAQGSGFCLGNASCASLHPLSLGN